ncbi:TVP38/TMEM64 family protein [Bacillus sp. DJP31]|uniref:TVP38/TMEM64 family protein n=1 Tax=Bacillus sp. DJP31 TaxID=3409789 RepID=UPI003BB77368
MKKYIIPLFSIIILVWYWENIYAFFTQTSLSEMANFIRSMGILAPVFSILLMVFQSIAAPIPSFLITGANGMVFGYVWGSLLSWFGAMLGALVSYYLAKKFGFKFVEKRFKGNKLNTILNKITGPYGFMFILLTRLIPLISFDLISFLAGLSGIKLRTFLLATGIGMIPGTIAYTVVGHDLLNFQDNINRNLIITGVITLFVLIGFFIKKKYIKAKKKEKNEF